MHCSTSVLSDAAAKLSTLKLAPLSGRGSKSARQRRGKLSRHYSNSVFVSLSLSLWPAHSHSLARSQTDGIALYSRNFVRGDSFVEAGQSPVQRLQMEWKELDRGREWCSGGPTNAQSSGTRETRPDRRGEMPALYAVTCT